MDAGEGGGRLGWRMRGGGMLWVERGRWTDEDGVTIGRKMDGELVGG